VAPCLSLFSPSFATRRPGVRILSRPPNYFAHAIIADHNRTPKETGRHCITSFFNFRVRVVHLLRPHPLRTLPIASFSLIPPLQHNSCLENRCVPLTHTNQRQSGQSQLRYQKAMQVRKTGYDEPSIRISITITDREHIFHWGRTRRSHERFSRRKCDRSWRYRRSVDCTTATNDGLPKKPESTRFSAASPSDSEINVRTVLPCALAPRRNSFARLKLGRKLLRLCDSPQGMASEVGARNFR
jgi:hypothetical protein